MASAKREDENVATWERWANAATWKRGGQHAASSLVVPAACLSACTCASTCSPPTSDDESIEWPPSPGDTPRLWKPPGRCSSPCKWTTYFNNIHNCDAYVEAHEFTDKRSSDRVIRIADRIAPPVISTPPMSMQSASAAWLPPAPPSSVPPKLLQTMLPFTQDDLEQARRAAVARARTHAKARAAQFKKEEDEEETEEDGEEMDDGETGLMAPRAHVGAGGWQHRREMSDGQQKVLVAATEEGLTLTRQNLPTPPIVRNTFIEVPVALPLSSRFSRLRRAASCPAGGERVAADCCSMLAQEESEDEAAVVAMGAPELLPQMQPLELAGLSVGSMKHGSRRCKPCVFVHTEEGCANGTDCPFCHACGPGEKRRQQKAKQQHRKRRLLRQRQAAKEKEVIALLQFATEEVHAEVYQPFTEYQHHVSMQGAGMSCL
mmetsp:Transcript_117665/g.234445  ORF Transcript_117665/g.234445 Transcript_117665/m.234445 type:complete len:433 (-) Transcript_117665:348-1646(-)